MELQNEIVRSPRLKGEVALVVGSTRGTGAAIAEALGREGAQVIVAGRNAENGAKVVKAIEIGGGEASFVSYDVAKEGDARQAIESAVNTYGKLTVLVNNA